MIIRYSKYENKEAKMSIRMLSAKTQQLFIEDFLS